MGEISMVERVAKAIYHGTARNKPYEQLSVFQKQGCLLMARAAIEAMREPTEGMMVEAEIKVPELFCFDDKDKSPSYVAWQAMISVALTDREG